MCACFALVTGPCRVTVLGVHAGACMVVCRRAAQCFPVLYTLNLDGKSGNFTYVSVRVSQSGTLTGALQARWMFWSGPEVTMRSLNKRPECFKQRIRPATHSEQHRFRVTLKQIQ